MGKGYDLDLIRSVTSRLSIPVIACGGAGKFADLAAAICDAGALAAATADIFCFKKLSHLYAKQAVREAGVSVRPSAVLDMARRKPPRAL
jgi:imidazole glycerol-phosphate synthase subunit HisF